MSRTRPIAPAELRALLKVLPDAAALAVRISADTGLRISDVLAIRSGDLAPTMQVTERKTGKARRVRIRPATIAAARAYASHGHDQLIPYNRSTIYRQIRAAAAELGYTHISMHSIRKYYARQYCRAHGLAATQREMQHNYLSTTLQRAPLPVKATGAKDWSDTARAWFAKAQERDQKDVLVDYNPEWAKR